MQDITLEFTGNETVVDQERETRPPCKCPYTCIGKVIVGLICTAITAWGAFAVFNSVVNG